MSRAFELYSKNELTLLGNVSVINEPKISEEINGSYTLNFEIDYRDKDKLNRNVLIKADDQYFQISRIVKSRYDTITLAVSCEHISYELIVDGTLEEPIEYETTAADMIAQVLDGTRFNIGVIMSTDVKYYNTTDLDRRKRLFDIANLFGGELIFDNFTVSLVQQRGGDKGLDIKLGVNLRGVTEEQNFVEGRTSYEIDLVDLSKVQGYQSEFATVEIGDTITIVDGKLGINTNERILSIEYDPFRKILPSVTVGDYVRDLTEYFKDEEGEEEEEKDIKSLFKQFKIGGVDMLKLSTDASNDVLNYLTNKYELGIEVSGKYNTLESKLVGIVAERASNSSGIFSVVQTKTNESGLLITTITEITSTTQLGSVIIKDTEHITLVISDKSLDHYKANPVEAETANIKAIGICVSFNNNDSVFLEKFNVGKTSVLGLEGNDVTELIEQFVSNQSVSPVATAEIELEIDEFLEGLDVVPTEDYLKWHLTLIHSVEGETEGSWTHTIRDLPIADYASFKVPTNNSDSVIVVVSNEPFSAILDGTASSELYYRAFGGTFKSLEPLKTASDYFSKFDLEDINLLDIIEDQNETIVKYIFGDGDLVTPTNTYEIDENKVGLFVEKAEQYQDKHITLIDFRIKEGSPVNPVITPYTDEQHTWNWTATYDERGIIMILSRIPYDELTAENITDNLIASFGVNIVLGERPQSNASEYFSVISGDNNDFLTRVQDETQTLRDFFINGRSSITSSNNINISDSDYNILAETVSNYDNYNVIMVTSTDDNGFEIINYYESNSSVGNSDSIPFDGLRTSYFFAISNIPYDEINESNANDAIVVAFGINISIGSENPPIDVEGGQILFIGHNLQEVVGGNYSNDFNPGTTAGGIRQFNNGGPNRDVILGRTLKYNFDLIINSVATLDARIEILVQDIYRTYEFFDVIVNLQPGNNAISFSRLTSFPNASFSVVDIFPINIRINNALGTSIQPGNAVLTITAPPNEIPNLVPPQN